MSISENKNIIIEEDEFSIENSSNKIKKVKKTQDIKTYHKEYKQNNVNWKEYLSLYVEKNKDKLNEKKRIDRKVKNELFNLMKISIENNSVFFKNEEDMKIAKSLVFFKEN